MLRTRQATIEGPSSEETQMHAKKIVFKQLIFHRNAGDLTFDCYESVKMTNLTAHRPEN